MAAPPTWQQPPVGWSPPPPAGGGKRRGVIAAVIAGVVLLTCSLVMTGGFFLVRSVEKAVSGSASPPTASAPAAGGKPTPSAPSAVDDVPQGPVASEYPATDIADLDRVCDENVYYPQSPKRAGKAPHPVVLLVAERPGMRIQNSSYYYPQGMSTRVEQTWAAQHPGKVQMVACLDKVGSGSKIRSCKYDDPKPESVNLVRAKWRLRVYEVATGRMLRDKAMAGDNQSCPSLVLIYEDRTIYAEVSDKAVLANLRSLVTK